MGFILAQNCPGQLGIRITGFRINEGPLLENREGRGRQ